MWVADEKHDFNKWWPYEIAILNLASYSYVATSEHMGFGYVDWCHYSSQNMKSVYCQLNPLNCKSALFMKFQCCTWTSSYF